MKCWKFHETDLGQKVENDPGVCQKVVILIQVQQENKNTEVRDVYECSTCKAFMRALFWSIRFSFCTLALASAVHKAKSSSSTFE